MNVRQKFKSAIKRGTGESHLLIKNNPTVDFSNDIIKASLTNFAYDNQSEGSRTVYISELISLSRQQDKIRKAIMKGLATERKDDWALNQLFYLTAAFAKKGDKEAKNAIYKWHSKINHIKYFEGTGDHAIIELDGIEGLKYIIEAKGKILINDKEAWEDSILVDNFQKNNPKLKVYKELETAGKKNKYIKIYLDTIRSDKFKRPKQKRQKYNYKVVAEKIDNKEISPLPLPPLYAKDLSKIDVKKLAEDFLKATNRQRQEKYLRVFDKVKFPYNYHPILKLAQSKYNNKDRLIEFASGSLKYFSGSDIRQFAIKKLRTAKNPWTYLDLLVSNYKFGDSRLLTSIVNKYDNPDSIHSFVWGYINIYTANKTKECAQPLTAIYNRLTCGLHRKDIVKIMLDNKVLPDRIKKEIPFDSNEEIRKLYKDRLKNGL